MRSLLLVASVAMTVGSQQRPDFSGDWLLNLQASALSPNVAAAAKSGTLRIDHKEPTFKYQMTIVFADKPVETKYEMLTDGRDNVTTANGRGIVSTLTWDGAALVALNRIEIPNGEMTIRFRYELENSGRRLRATEQLRGAGRDQDNVWVFERP